MPKKENYNAIFLWAGAWYSQSNFLSRISRNIKSDVKNVFLEITEFIC